jgi:exonuclease SbcC
MIPIRLRISGFLSYCEPVELDFTSFDLACISGPNGAGKSSLLDAITWALFGQARKRDDSLINLQSRAAEVVLTFRYEGAVYRVQRSLVRGKTPVLEFQVQQPAPALDPQLSPSSPHGIPGSDLDQNATWRPLTERTLRETQSRIEQTLRLDYDTFVNASFFLQGKADQFAQQSPGKRKEVLSNILGLGTWETYRARATEARRLLEDEITAIDGRRTEIAAELAEEAPRRQRLAQLEADLGRLSAARKVQDATLDTARKTAAAREQQRTLVNTLAASLERSLSQVAAMESRMAERQLVRAADAGLIQRTTEINSAQAAWKKARAELEQWDTVASTFREHEQRRAPLVESIAVEKARLGEEQRGLLLEQQEIDNQAASIRNLEYELLSAQGFLAEVDARVADRLRLESEHSRARESHASLNAENEVLRTEMEALKTRMSTLTSAVGAACPLCGQPLSARHRRSTLKALEAEGKQRGDRFRANKLSANKMALAVAHLESELGKFSSVEVIRLDRSAAVAQLAERLETLRSLSRAWKATGLRRLRELQNILEREKYALDARKQLARVDKELSRLGYDAAAHDGARRAEQQQRSADEDFRRLQSAVAALAPLDNEIQNLGTEIANRKTEIAAQEADVARAQASLETAGRESPDFAESERLLFDLQEQENRLNQEIGAARQKVSVLENLRLRDAEFESSRQSLALRVGRHKALERAFSKDGVPSLLIEQALPEIESRANELLDRLSDGQMSVRFLTQAGYKDRKREDLKETLEIQISDGAGVRDYEMYSGGEAFRIDFAVRLALSEVLAGRKAARLQTLVVDEGFGSQDIQGRQRLIEAINLVKHDFSMILVITHLDELKDAFPTRIEVEKTPTGSRAWVV